MISGIQNLMSPVGMDFLNADILAANSANSAILTIPARDILLILVSITGYTGGGGIGSLRFGGVAGAVDSGNNYNTRYLRINAGANNNFTNVPTNTTNMLRLGSQAITLGRMVAVSSSNNATTRKNIMISTCSEAGGVGVEPPIDIGQGLWGNTTQQIVSVQLTVTANQLTTGTTLQVYGRNSS